MAAKPAARPASPAASQEGWPPSSISKQVHTHVHAPVTISLIFSIVAELACGEGWVVRTQRGGLRGRAAAKVGRLRQQRWCSCAAAAASGAAAGGQSQQAGGRGAAGWEWPSCWSKARLAGASKGPHRKQPRSPQPSTPHLLKRKAKCER